MESGQSRVKRSPTLRHEPSNAEGSVGGAREPGHLERGRRARKPVLRNGSRLHFLAITCAEIIVGHSGMSSVEARGVGGSKGERDKGGGSRRRICLVLFRRHRALSKD